MAVAPTFVLDMATLKLDLRLQGIRTGSEAESLLNRATSGARITLYQRLGLATMAELVVVAEVDNPTTLLDIRRKAASLVEVELVRCSLLQTMPVMVGDASGDAQQTYNDEGVWRQVDPTEMEDILHRCSMRIEELFELILQEDGLGDDATVRVYDGRGNDCPRRPAGTAFPHIRLFPGNFEQQYHGPWRFDY